jgi:hypothetical protein
MQMNNLKFRHMFGHFGTYNYSLPLDTVEIKMFNSSQSGAINFVDPKLRIDVTNSFGVSTEGTFTAFIGQSNSQSLVPLTGLPTPLVISAPPPTNPIVSQFTSLCLNSTNSNFPDFFTNLTNKIIYKLDATFNPNGNNGAPNFVADTSRLGVSVKAELPLWGSAGKVVMIDTLDFELPEYIDDMERAVVRVNVENGFPLESQIQVYFTDTSHVIIDSLVHENAYVIASGAVDGNGKVEQSGTAITDITIDKARWQNLHDQNAKRIIVKGSLATYNNGATDVRIYNTYALDVRIGARVIVNMNP